MRRVDRVDVGLYVGLGLALYPVLSRHRRYWQPGRTQPLFGPVALFVWSFQPFTGL